MPEPEPEPEIPSSSTTDDKNNDNNHNSDHALRFEAELEFVQCLANVPYLQFLAQSEYFDSPDFIAYLDYLQYWRQPQYARFIVYPHALYFLHLLQEQPFREAMKSENYMRSVHEQQGLTWKFGKAIKLSSETVNGEGGNDKADQPPPTAATNPVQPSQN